MKELVNKIKGDLKKMKDKLIFNDEEPKAPYFVQPIIDHAETFESIMDFHVTKRMVFSISLHDFLHHPQGLARNWYRLLTPYTISPWKQLQKALIAKFVRTLKIQHLSALKVAGAK